MNYLITATAITALALTETLVDILTPFALLVTIACALVATALLFQMHRADRHNREVARRRADRQFARQHRTNGKATP
jgi:mannose/fructose/N-acetylgalactosamine-specific phosphotransferase system component IIC